MKKLKNESMSKAIYSYYLGQFNPRFLMKIGSNNNVENFFESDFNHYDIFKCNFLELVLGRIKIYIYLLFSNPGLFFNKLKFKLRGLIRK